MKKCTFFLSLMILFTILHSCQNTNKTSQVISNKTSHNIPSNTLDSIVRVIIPLSARDFYQNQQPVPVGFKNVQLKYIQKTNGEELYLLCGQFETTDHQVVPFATIKNNEYEQWIGNNALTYCQNAQEIPYTMQNLSSALKNELDRLVHP